MILMRILRLALQAMMSRVVSDSYWSLASQTQGTLLSVYGNLLG